MGQKGPLPAQQHPLGNLVTAQQREMSTESALAQPKTQVDVMVCFFSVICVFRVYDIERMWCEAQTIAAEHHRHYRRV